MHTPDIKGRLVVVSNRLPFSAAVRNQALHFSESAGGLVSGLSSYLQGLRNTCPSVPENYLWVGWPGNSIPEEAQAELASEARRRFSAVPVFLDQKEMDEFYYGFCNKTIWPLFHYFPSYTSYSGAMWEQYRRVNERFADALAPLLEQGDAVWIHDYHLMLLPAILRARHPEAQIGFFLHIPFPSFEIFRLLPGKWRREILEGLLGADLVGFHTYDYTQHFLQCVLRILDRDHHLGLIKLPTHVVTAQTFPMGIDYARYDTAAQLPAVQDEVQNLRQALRGARVILSVDRLDYTKGILNRLEGFANLLERYPEHCGSVVLAVIMVPSRVMVEEYEAMKRQIEEFIGKINGAFGTMGWTPVLYQYRYLPFEPLAALYTVSEVALVTPLRDGMNLVAKEYLAARGDGTGVLVLSEMAGVAKELGEAIIVNPNNREEIADALHEALAMPEAEQRRRNSIMRTRLKRYDVRRWAEDFTTTLRAMQEEQEQYLAKLLGETTRQDLVADYGTTSNRLILLDYDGTLVPLARRPALAKPTESVLKLLAALASDERNTVVLISSRDKTVMHQWFGHLPISLVAEHGMWVRGPLAEWTVSAESSDGWKARLVPIMELYCDRLPGSFLEVKDFSVAWHYRAADPEQSRAMVGEVSDHLSVYTANIDVQVIHGKKVIEVKTTASNKGAAARRWVQAGEYDFILSLGDDWTDEDMFAALPEKAYTIKIGLTSTRARFTLRDSREAVSLLNVLAKCSNAVARPERTGQSGL